ncbi:MAG: hypothetical protein EOP02_17325 [Proteobacteria bacterium]|nr:MAG: hypothetical protein EOP02_17325 [Pseudomonadota bacterium]
MKRLLIGAAVGALLLPASTVLAQDIGHDHACIDDACTLVSLFSGEETAAGWQGTEAPVELVDFDKSLGQRVLFLGSKFAQIDKEHVA